MTGTNRQPQKALTPPKEGRAASPLRWYFVCPSCDAKWFHTLPRHPCPRCGMVVAAGDRLVPPWRQ